jgi:hypothetical protein
MANPCASPLLAGADCIYTQIERGETAPSFGGIGGIKRRAGMRHLPHPGVLTFQARIGLTVGLRDYFASVRIEEERIVVMLAEVQHAGDRIRYSVERSLADTLST